MRMKHFTLLSTCMFALGSITMQAQTHRIAHTNSPIAFMKAQVNKSLRTQGTTPQKAAQAKRTAATRLAALARAESLNKHEYKPQHQIEYALNDDTQEWEKSAEYTNTYDANGRLTVQLMDDGATITRTEYTYNKDNNITLMQSSVSEDGGSTFTPSEKREQTYDEFVPNLVIEKKRFEWDNNAWITNGDAYKRTIKRDADNNVTSLVISVPYNGEYEDTKRITNTFDSDTKKADTFKYEELDYNDDHTALEWEVTEQLKNMTWHKTNGQLVSEYGDWINYGNELEEASVYFNEDGQEYLGGQIAVKYDDNGGFNETIDYSVLYPGKDVTSLTYTDDNGSYVYENEYYEADKDAEGVTEDDLQEHSKSVAQYDDHGNLVLEINSELNEDGTDLEITDGTKYDYTYDNTTDAEKEVVVSMFDYDSKEYLPFMKIVTDAYTDITGIHQATNKAETATTQIYNLQGIRTNSTASRGVYIIRQGNTVKKVIK